MELLRRSNIETKGKHTVVLGRSNIVGKPIANLLYQKRPDANSVVTICHTGADDIKYYTRQADILIAAVGVPEIIKSDYIKEGVVIIDVGINRVPVYDENGEPVLTTSGKQKKKTVGDVDFDSAVIVAGAITPVPGGVGPVTVAILLQNVITAAEQLPKEKI